LAYFAIGGDHTGERVGCRTVGFVDIGELIALETEVWQALVDGDTDADRRLLSDDFLGVYPTGFSGRADHVDQIDGGPTVRTFELSEARMVVVSDDAVVLAYRAVYERVGEASHPEAMYVSSLWCRRDGRWVNVFSQDTPDTGIAVV
jgi:hypothetical protein